MSELKKLRTEIDDIDTEILNLLNKRAHIVLEIELPSTRVLPN